METSLPNTTPTKVSALRDNEAHPQKSNFIPPFIKNVKLDPPNSKASFTFVPPFKKLRNFSKTEDEEHKHHFMAPFTNPSTEKHTASVTGNKPAEDVPLVTLAETANDERVKSPGSEDPAAEAVCVEDTLPRGKHAAWCFNDKSHITKVSYWCLCDLKTSFSIITMLNWLGICRICESGKRNARLFFHYREVCFEQSPLE